MSAKKRTTARKRNYKRTAQETKWEREYNRLLRQPSSNLKATERRYRLAKMLRDSKEKRETRGEQNPHPTVAGAARLYKTFIGKAARKVTHARTAHPAAVKAKGAKLPVAKLARLSYLRIKNPAIKGGMIRFSGAARPALLSHAGGKQYYFHGGKQSLAGIPGIAANPANVTPAMLKRAGLDRLPDSHKLVPLGEVAEIGYFERKKVENFRPVEYFHHFGEENGRRPILVYDSSNKQMHLVGGDYRTKWSGINN